METWLQWTQLDIVGFWETVLRVVLAAIFGLALGIDRELKGKPIDFKAFMIVAITSCLVAVVGQEIYADYANAENVAILDFGKLIGGVLTGIGFLGAGAIIRVRDGQVVGSATGASIWASGIIGLALGFGFYGLSLIGFVAITLVLAVFGQIKRPSEE